MDVSQWPLGRIMQLPDWVFGQRWPIGLNVELTDADPVFAINRAGLPETCVIWELSVPGTPAVGVTVEVTLALGDQLPGSDAEFGRCEIVMPDVVSRVYGGGGMEAPGLCEVGMEGLRMAVRSAGRRFIGRFQRLGGGAVQSGLIIVISSVPKEVPDCLLSG